MKKSHPILQNIESVRPYKLTTGHHLYTIDPPAMQIDDFLPVGGIMGITSQPGAGKSWLAMAIAQSVGSGENFLGRFKARRGGVLFVGSDSSLYDYARQWTRLTSHVELAAHIYEPVRFLIQSSFMFEDRDEVRKLIATHNSFEWGDFHVNDEGAEKEKGFHVIVFDTVSKLTRANQNDNTDMEEVFRHIRWIAEATNAAVILIHHNSKKTEFNDGADWRGASSQFGALDSWIQLNPSLKDKYKIAVEYKKFRGITPANFAYKMNVSDPKIASLCYTDELVITNKHEDRQVNGELGKEILRYIGAHPKQRAIDIVNGIWASEWKNDVIGQQWTDRKKFETGVRNSLNSLKLNGFIFTTASPEGKPVYELLKTKIGENSGEVVAEQAEQAGVVDQGNATPVAGIVSAAGKPGSRRRRNAAAAGVREEGSADSGAGEPAGQGS